MHSVAQEDDSILTSKHGDYNISIRMMFINCWPVLNQSQEPKEPSHALTATLGRALRGEKAEEVRMRSTRSVVTLEPKQVPEWLQGLDKEGICHREAGVRGREASSPAILKNQ